MVGFPERVTGRARPAKAPLSTRTIVDAALTIIRAEGAASLRLRDVAAALDTGPASLYAYFDNRDVLLSYVLDAVYAEVELVSAASGGWRTALVGTISNTVDVLVRYRGMGLVALEAVPTLPGALRLAEHELGLLELGGVQPADAAMAIDLIAQFAASTSIEQSAHAASDGARSAKGLIAGTDAGGGVDFPRVRAAAQLLTGPDAVRRRRFGIEVLLAGLEALH